MLRKSINAIKMFVNNYIGNGGFWAGFIVLSLFINLIIRRYIFELYPRERGKSNEL